jgi:hypothetical protein
MRLATRSGYFFQNLDSQSGCFTSTVNIISAACVTMSHEVVSNAIAQMRVILVAPLPKVVGALAFRKPKRKINSRRTENVLSNCAPRNLRNCSYSRRSWGSLFCVYNWALGVSPPPRDSGTAPPDVN